MRVYLDIKADVSKRQKDSRAMHVWLVLGKAANAGGQNATASVSELGLGLSDFAVLEVLLHRRPQPVTLETNSR